MQQQQQQPLFQHSSLGYRFAELIESCATSCPRSVPRPCGFNCGRRLTRHHSCSASSERHQFSLLVRTALAALLYSLGDRLEEDLLMPFQQPEGAGRVASFWRKRRRSARGGTGRTRPCPRRASSHAISSVGRRPARCLSADRGDSLRMSAVRRALVRAELMCTAFCRWLRTLASTSWIRGRPSPYTQLPSQFRTGPAALWSSNPVG